MSVPRAILTFLICLVISLPIVTSSSIAFAQPSRTAPRPLPQQNFGGYYSQYQVPPYYHLLSFEERQLLHDGKISQGQVVGGGLMALFLGFGTGQAVQGRWSTMGWKFALAEGAGITAMIIGISSSLSHDSHQGSGSNSDEGVTLLIGGLLTYSIAHLWEIVDAFAAPASHNRRYNQVKWKAYGQPYAPHYSLFIAPNNDSGGGVAGLKMSF